MQLLKFLFICVLVCVLLSHMFRQIYKNLLFNYVYISYPNAENKNER